MHNELIPVQRARKERFAGMANALFYSRFINTSRLKTKLIGARRYTTDQWVRECLAAIADDVDSIEAA
jgi:hypothetical protein